MYRKNYLWPLAAMFFDGSKNLNNLTRGHPKTIFARLIDYLQIRPEGFDGIFFIYTCTCLGTLH